MLYRLFPPGLKEIERKELFFQVENMEENLGINLLTPKGIREIILPEMFRERTTEGFGAYDYADEDDTMVFGCDF